MENKKKCMSCHEEITPENNGMKIEDGIGGIYQCYDCHFIEFGENIWSCNLVFQDD